MPGESDLIERSGDLKRELVDFALRPRFERALRQASDAYFPGLPELEEADLGDFLDWFILQRRLPGGHTVVEKFVDDHPELPEEERAMLLGWRDVVEGIFEVKQREPEALVAVNLVDELSYRVRSNMGPAALRPMRSGSFLITRIVPVGNEWILSGYTEILPAGSSAEAKLLATALALERPDLVFRNPEKLAQAWEAQRREREHFTAFFGADLVVLPGRDVAERMRGYAQFRVTQVRDAEGKTVAEQAAERYGAVPPLDFTVPAAFSEEQTVAVIFDEVEGLGLYAGFGLVEEAFADPARAADREHRPAVLEYLKARDISPLPLRRLAERDPERASQVFQRVLKQPRFSWPRDGEALLRRYKASYFRRPALPSLTLVNDPAEVLALAAPAPSQSKADRWKRWLLRKQ